MNAAICLALPTENNARRPDKTCKKAKKKCKKAKKKCNSTPYPPLRPQSNSSASKINPKLPKYGRHEIISSTSCAHQKRILQPKRIKNASNIKSKVPPNPRSSNLRADPTSISSLACSKTLISSTTTRSILLLPTGEQQ